ncbi:MAG: thiol:disulfide interchange protein [Helicobacteraceae bacterium CG2_30_36_10]|nr:MAG: thiol:disulfide interchange protein [Helicobacteraceae bacterium CG2_30_36_10]
MKKILFFLLLVSTIFAAPKFLMPDEAFIPHATLGENMEIEASVEIAEGIYLYADKLTLMVKDSDEITVKNIVFPKSVEHHDEMVYLESPQFVLSLQKKEGVTGVKSIDFELSYQGCSEQGLCYEPLSKVYSFDIDTSKLSIISKVKRTQEIVVTEISETDSIADTIVSGSVGIIILTFLGFGFLLALTPCVFPMIPIISGLIISQGEGITTKRAFLLSVVYVLAMAVAYTIAGVLAGLFGANLQAALQTPWVIYSFAGVFVALAMSMFGFYELKVPSFIIEKVSGPSKNTGVIGVAIMGFLSALIVGPCVAAPLAGALVYIGQTGDAVLGGMALFALSIGMGIPLIAVGVSAGKFMPKPGMWMTMVTAVFGVMMLGVAIWMLERVVDYHVIMLLWAMLGIGSALYFGAFKEDVQIFIKSVAVIVFIYSVVLFIGVLGGSQSMSTPLEFLKPQAVSLSIQKETRHVEFAKVTSIKELDTLLLKNKGKKIMLDFYADWCTACKEMEAVTFANADVKAKLGEFVLIQADVTANGEDEKALSKKYGVFGPPVLIFFDEGGEVMKAKTIVGFVEPAEFLAHLNTI